MRLTALAILVSLCTQTLAQVVLESPEPNGSRLTATPLPPGQQAEGAIAFPGDVDFYRVVVTAPCDLRLWTGPGLVNPIGDTEVELLDAQGNLLADVNDGNLLTHGFYSILSYGNVAPGVYFIEVDGFPALQTGSYSLDVIAGPVGTYAQRPILAPVAEAPESNDPRNGGQPTASALFTANAGSIAIGGGGTSWSATTVGSQDYDWYAFQVAQPCTITLQTRAPAPASGSGPQPGVGDTVLHLCNASFTRLAFDDDTGEGDYSLLSYAIASPGVYYAAVNGFCGSHVGGYVLDILGPLPPLPVGPSSFTELPPTCVGPLGPVRIGTRPNSFGFPGRPEQPLLGSTFCLDVQNLAPNGIVVAAFDARLAAVPFAGGPLQGTGCQFELPLDTSIAQLCFADLSGYCCWALPLPLRLDLIGFSLQLQVLTADPAAASMSALASNRATAVCGVSH